MQIFNLYVNLRNFLVSNFFINILCLKHQDTFIYLDEKYSIFRYILLLCPFYFVNLIANRYNYELIYKMDGIYSITNIDSNHIIPFIQSCMMMNDKASLNISSNIRLYNSSIPLHFFIHTSNLHHYNRLYIIYLNKGNQIKKDINLEDIDTKKCLIYNLFD